MGCNGLPREGGSGGDQAGVTSEGGVKAVFEVSSWSSTTTLKPVEGEREKRE